MATSYTTIWRLPVMTVGDPLVKNAWGTVLNAAMPLIEQGGVGNTPISIAGLTSYTLTTADDAADQARLNTYNFNGALTGNCTAIIPAVARVGWVTNSTTGGYNVVLTTGSGTTLTVAPGLTYFWSCDGTNIATVSLGATTLTVSGGIVGDTTGGSAAAGIVGEYVSATVSVGSAVSLSNNVTANVTSMSLSAGDWDVGGLVSFSPGAGTAMTGVFAAISTISATFLPTPGGGIAQVNPGGTVGWVNTLVTGQVRIDVSTTTTVYLVAEASFSGGTLAAYGFISARRAR